VCGLTVIDGGSVQGVPPVPARFATAAGTGSRRRRTPGSARASNAGRRSPHAGRRGRPWSTSSPQQGRKRSASAPRRPLRPATRKRTRPSSANTPPAFATYASCVVCVCVVRVSCVCRACVVRVCVCRACRECLRIDFRVVAGSGGLARKADQRKAGSVDPQLPTPGFVRTHRRYEPAPERGNTHTRHRTRHPHTRTRHATHTFPRGRSAPGVDIGDWFPNRIITSKSGVHRYVAL
jgi:hypothetical protein